MTKAKTTNTTPLRIISILFGIFFFLVPARMGSKWSPLHIGFFYFFATCYVTIAIVRINKIAKSLLATVALAGLTAFPFITTFSQLVYSAVNLNLREADMYMWMGVSLTLILELILPLTLIIEFIRTKESPTSASTRVP